MALYFCGAKFSADLKRIPAVVSNTNQSSHNGFEIDFVQKLPLRDQSQTFISEIYNISNNIGLRLKSININKNNKDANKIGRTLVSIEVEGKYRSIREMISRIDEKTSIVIANISMRQLSGGGETSCHLDLIVLSRPPMQSDDN